MKLSSKRRIPLRHPVRHLAMVALAFVVLTATSCTPRELAAINQKLINDDRAAAGLASLAWDENAATKAQGWADYMASRRQIVHSDVTAGISGGWTILGENVGYASSIDRAQDLFMQSARHRSAILNPRFTSVGIGVAKNGNDYYVAQVFRG